MHFEGIVASFWRVGQWKSPASEMHFLFQMFLYTMDSKVKLEWRVPLYFDILRPANMHLSVTQLLFLRGTPRRWPTGHIHREKL